MPSFIVMECLRFVLFCFLPFCSFHNTLRGILGYLSPASRGSFFVAALCFFCVFAGAGGFVAGRMHRALVSPTLLLGHTGGFASKDSSETPPLSAAATSPSSPGSGFLGRVSQLLRVPWVPPGLLVAMGYPGLIFTGFAAANLALHAAGSSAAVPIHAAIALAFLWLAVAAPLAFCGAASGHGRPPIEYPVPVDPFPRFELFFLIQACCRPLTTLCLEALLTSLPYECV